MAKPKIRFKRTDGSIFPDWNIRKMGALTEEYKVRNKSKLPLEIYSVNNEVGFLPQSEQFEDAGYLNETDTSIYMIVPPNYFAYNPARINVGSIGYQNVGHDVQVSSLYEVFKTTNELDDGFLWHWFHTPIFNKAVQRLQEGGVRQYYYYDKLKETSITLPCLEEQQSIAAFLSTIDEVITESAKEVADLVLQKKAAMKKIFTKEVRFTRQDGSSFPEWENLCFGDVFTEIVRKTSDTETYPLFSLTIEDGVTVKTERYERSYLVKKTEDNYKIVPPNAFIYNPMNLRFGALAPSHEDKEVCVSQYYNVFLLNDETTLGFWESYLVTDDMLKFYFSIATGSLMEKLRVHYSNFVNIMKPIPCAEEQRFIAGFLSDFDEAIAAAKRELELWRKLKKGLLQQMFV